MRLRDKMLSAAGVHTKGDYCISNNSSSSYSTGFDFDSDSGVESTTTSVSAAIEMDAQFKVVDSDCYSHNEETSSRMSRLVTLLFMAIALEAGVVTLLVRSYWPSKGSTTSSFIYSPPAITCCRYDRFYTHHPVSGQHCVVSDALQKECDFAVGTLYELYIRSQEVVCGSGAYYNHSIVLSSTECPLLADLHQIDSNCLPNSLTSTGIGSNVSLSQISYDKLQKSMSWSCLKESIQLAFYYCLAAFVILLLAIFVFDEWRRRHLEKVTLQTKLINATYQVIIIPPYLYPFGCSLPSRYLSTLNSRICSVQTLVEHAKHSPLDPLPVDILQVGIYTCCAFLLLSCN
eukprot:278890_1